MIRLERARIVVRCPASGAEPETDLEVEPVTWENTQYRIDPQTKEIAAETIGTFVQYPLRLAWAITIHKSQGLTFERAIIDAGLAFSPGQVYVALSRCKTFEGMVLSAPIPRRVIMTDQRVAHYVGEATREPPTQVQLEQARIAYQQRLLQACWDFDELGARLGRLLGELRRHHKVIDLRGADAMDALEQQTQAAVVRVGGSFRRELASLFRADQVPEDDAQLQVRVRKASAYFSGKLQEGLRPWLDGFAFDTDNQALGKALRQAEDDLRQVLAIKTAAVESCRDGFATTAYLAAVAKAQFDADERPTDARSAPRAKAAIGDAKGATLLAALQRWRARKAEAEERDGVTRYRILTRAVLRQIAANRPDSPAALTAINGIGKHTVERYGAEILAIVAEHRPQGAADTAANQGASPPGTTDADAEQGDTRLISYRLYQEGLSIPGIAERRALKTTTIEGHLAHYIGTGNLAITDFIDDEKRARIEAVLAETGTDTLGPAKDALGEDCSFGEIRMVLAHLKSQRA